MKRIPQLDGLRGVAVLMVFFHHALLVPLFWAGVDLFFVLSGYLITGILLSLKEKRESEGYAKTFYWRRIRRIVPPYVGFMLFLALFVSVPWRQVWYWYAFFGANFATAFGYANVKPMFPLWSLAVEEQFYFLWPWVVLLCSRKRLGQIALGIVIAAPILRGICTPLFSNGDPIYNLAPFRADLLAAGAFVAIATREVPGWIELNRKRALWSFLAGSTLLVGLSTRHSFHHTGNTLLFNVLGYSLVVIIMASALIQALGMREGLVYKGLTWRPLRYMGTISYTFYLYQVPFILMIGQHVHSRPGIVLLGFVATAIFATISWYVVESPILHWGRADSPAVVQLAGSGGPDEKMPPGSVTKVSVKLSK